MHYDTCSCKLLQKTLNASEARWRPPSTIDQSSKEQHLNRLSTNHVQLLAVLHLFLEGSLNHKCAAIMHDTHCGMFLWRMLLSGLALFRSGDLGEEANIDQKEPEVFFLQLHLVDITNHWYM